MKEINPINNNGSIQLKFTVNGKRYSFNPFQGGQFDNKRDLAQAKAIATKIQNDIIADCFDNTLNKYKPKNLNSLTKTVNLKTVKSFIVVWDSWVDTLDLSAATKADHYEMIRRMIVKADAGGDDISWFINAKLSPSTFNKRLGYLKSCCQWAVSQKLFVSNPFERVKARKSTKAEIKPFTIEEIRAIITEFDIKYSHYSAFVRFLFLTGTRTSEAIGLQWKQIDFERKQVTISESMPKDRTGNGYQRIRKETKSGNVRYLTINSELNSLLLDIKPDKVNPDDLLFKSSRGFTIDSGNFREDWKKVLSNIGIEYRKPYTTRHTLLSHAIEQGIPITGVAYLAGHTDTRMVMQTYGHMINRPVLPEFKL
ncbi:site-specific recombinase XerD [Synechococcus sp. PCC 7502]|uniref:site-specific integrase n=1 Tax=Synechococcus sp. PCC 7502 TaxID=1173263 RepID=UPI00029FD871|nr:site-specific integrase [Synechococcus sp. PCC 7502]AFY73472.1 site-specific recombinase XerD [Synechococcus sp. PCC 7502]